MVVRPHILGPVSLWRSQVTQLFSCVGAKFSSAVLPLDGPSTVKTDSQHSVATGQLFIPFALAK